MSCSDASLSLEIVQLHEFYVYGYNRDLGSAGMQALFNQVILLSYRACGRGTKR